MLTDLQVKTLAFNTTDMSKRAGCAIGLAPAPVTCLVTCEFYTFIS